MRMISSVNASGHRAAEALKSVLHQVSQVKLKRVDLTGFDPRGFNSDAPQADLKVDLLAHLVIHGRSHTLICKVRASGRPDHVRTALREFQVDASRFSANATPVLIAPHFSEEAKALCRESNASFLDLEGNARLDMGEVFIGQRSMPQARNRPVVSQTAQRDSAQIAGAA